MSSVKPIIGPAALAVALLASPAPLSAQVTSDQDTSRTPWSVNRGPGTFGRDTSAAAVAVSDTGFIRRAISGNALELELSRVAEDRADADTVEQFAERMVAEHGAMGRQWATLARNNGMTADSKLTPVEQLAVNRLTDLSGNAFDRAYMTNMIRLHERQLSDFERGATSSQSADVRRLAAAGATSIRNHLALARQVGNGIGAGPGVVAATPDTALQPTTPTSASVAADAGHIRQAIYGNGLEVRLAQIANRRAENDDVEDFAERMARDHSNLGRQWEALATANGVALEPELRPAQQRTVARLENLSGKEFDRAYMTEMIRHHEQELAAQQRAASSARTPEVRRLASTGVTAVRQHLELARQVGRKVGALPVLAGNPDDDDRDRDRDGGELRGEDRAFVMNVMADHLMHVRLAQRAQREARTADARRFAQRMEEDFTRWQERWSGLAERYGMRPPRNLGPRHGEKVGRLERASRQNVDRIYAAIVADHLASVVPYFQKEGQAVRSAAARRLVDEELPLIRERLQQARRLQGQASARAEGNDRD